MDNKEGWLRRLLDALPETKKKHIPASCRPDSGVPDPDGQVGNTNGIDADVLSHSSWSDGSGASVAARAGIGGPDTPGHDEFASRGHDEFASWGHDDWETDETALTNA
jgi:hypothetical protein